MTEERWVQLYKDLKHVLKLTNDSRTARSLRVILEEMEK